MEKIEVKVKKDDISEKNQKEMRKLYVYTFRKLTIVQGTFYGFIAWMVMDAYMKGLFANISLYGFTGFLGLLMVLALEVFIIYAFLLLALPNLLYLINKKEISTRICNDYKIIVNRSGITFVYKNQTKTFKFKNYKVVSCKYGLSLVTNFIPVASLLNLHTDEKQFETIVEWAKSAQLSK